MPLAERRVIGRLVSSHINLTSCATGEKTHNPCVVASLAEKKGNVSVTMLKQSCEVHVNKQPLGAVVRKCFVTQQVIGSNLNNNFYFVFIF